MRRQASTDKGLLFAYLINVLLHFEWGVIALVCWLLHLWLGVPDLLWRIALGVWLLWPAAITFLLSSLLGNPPPPKKPRPNKNPYSATTLRGTSGTSAPAARPEQSPPSHNKENNAPKPTQKD